MKRPVLLSLIPLLLVFIAVPTEAVDDKNTTLRDTVLTVEDRLARVGSEVARGESQLASAKALQSMKEAIDALRRLGASVSDDGRHVDLYNHTGGSVYRPDEILGPGNKGFLRGGRVGPLWKGGDEGLVHLQRLNKLEYLDLSHNWYITDASLEYLKSLTSLRHVNLFGSNKISDAGLAHLAELDGLEELSLASTGITCTGSA